MNVVIGSPSMVVVNVNRQFSILNSRPVGARDGMDSGVVSE